MVSLRRHLQRWEKLNKSQIEEGERFATNWQKSVKDSEFAATFMSEDLNQT